MEKILKFYNGNKKKIWLLAAFIVIFVVFSQSTFMYNETIGKIKKIETSLAGEETDGSSTIAENTYTQTMKVKILNGKHKGETIEITNTYSYSRVDTIRYRKGNQLFLNVPSSGNVESAKISYPRRDFYALGIVLILIYILIVVGKVKGIFSILSVVINAGVFIFCLRFFDSEDSIIRTTLILIVVFTVITLSVVNGINKRTIAAIISTFIASAVTIGIFLLVRRYGSEIDYASLDYLTGDLEYEAIFFASIALAGLGAIMDVTISIAATLNEVMEKNNSISYLGLFKSGREVGHDIMGTMTNVLLFTYVCGLIPLTLIKLRNEVSFFSIIRLQIPFEICRFLIGGIGIVVAIPISIVISMFMLKTLRRGTVK
ncbi:MAG: YibE/F family protein [Suipraeoptans sp.]